MVSSRKYRMYLLRGTLYPLHVADAADPRALLREAPLAKRKKETDRHTLCSMRTRQSAKSPRVQKLRGQREGERERENRVCHGPVDSINGNNATSVRRFIDDAIELRFSSPFFESHPLLPFSILFLRRSSFSSSATLHSLAQTVNLPATI